MSDRPATPPPPPPPAPPGLGHPETRGGLGILTKQVALPLPAGAADHDAAGEGSYQLVRAHSAGHPWPAGDTLSQAPRSATSTTRSASAVERPAADRNPEAALSAGRSDRRSSRRAGFPVGEDGRSNRRRRGVSRRPEEAPRLAQPLLLDASAAPASSPP